MSKKCEFCDATREHATILAVEEMDLGRLGKAEATLRMRIIKNKHKGRRAGDLLLSLWHEEKSEDPFECDGESIGETSIPINYCPACGRRVDGEEEPVEKKIPATEHIGSEGEVVTLPIPCTKGYKEATVKDWFQKINEELDELKEAVLAQRCLHEKAYVSKWYMEAIADEAADTITAITSMLEAIGIDEEQRQEAQRRVNAKNRERGRF